MPTEILARRGLPAFTQFDPAQVLPAVTALLTALEATVTEVTASDAAPTWDTLFGPLEAAEQQLSRAWSTIGHLHNVADSDALRKPYSEAEEAITAFHAGLLQNRALYERARAFADSPAAAALRPSRRAIVDHWLRDFRLGGVALEEPARSRFKAIAQEASRLSTEFEEALLDATDAWSLHLGDDTRLAGVPDTALAGFRSAASAKGLEGWLLTLRGPSYQAIMTYADDRSLRAELYQAHATRASELGPFGGRFDNGPRIDKLLALRHEGARLLGFANAADESLATKMAPSAERVLDFLEDLVRRARPAAQRELDELAAFAATTLGLPELAPWDVGYAAEKLKAARFDFDDEQLKAYFPLSHVLGGLFAIIEKLFGVRAREREVETWHPDARYYELIDGDGQVVAGCYLDLFAREKKRGGAWMDVCRTRFRHPDGALELPVAYLNCNFAPPAGSQPALLTHDELLTLFHEFGHGLHHMLSRVEDAGVSGISGVEWDAVELPSQFMENFCWTDAGLDLLAKHWQSGELLPAALRDKLKQTREFHAGLFLVRQLEFGLYDFLLHRDHDPGQASRVLSLLDEVRQRVAVLRPPEWNRFPMSFSHIFAGGYAAGYYSYLWAEVLSADAFSAFPETDLLDQLTGERFRREVLEVGGSRPALESFIAFRGREPDAGALLKSYGLAA